MLTKLREPFGKAGLIVAIVALIAALGGGAYAASGGLSGKQKKEVEKIAKKYAGKPGANGTNGTNGAPGAKGDTGAAGANGTNGTNGSPGGAGASVEEETITAGGGETRCGGRGGAEYRLEEASAGTEVCNGKEGSPWTVGGLPTGQTEIGAWSFNASLATASASERIFVPFSLPVPLSANIEGEANIHFVEVGGPTGGCTGTIQHPTAPPGMACFYANESLTGATFQGERELEASENWIVNPGGGFLTFKVTADHALGNGSFAVTGG